MSRRPARDWVAIILAAGLALAVNLITAAVLYDAVFSEGPGLSENATQIITGAFGGIIGVLGAYLGLRSSSRQDGAGSPQEPPGPE